MNGRVYGFTPLPSSGIALLSRREAERPICKYFHPLKYYRYSIE